MVNRQVVSVSILLRVSQEPRVIPNSNSTFHIPHSTCQPDDDGTGKLEIGRVRTAISAQSELGRLGLVATRRPWAVGWNPRCLPRVCPRSTASQHPISLESNTQVHNDHSKSPNNHHSPDRSKLRRMIDGGQRASDRLNQ